MPNIKEFQFTVFSFNVAIPGDQACQNMYPEHFPLGWVQTRSALTPQPARKLFETKGSDMSPSLQQAWKQMVQEWGQKGIIRLPYRWIHLPTSEPIQGKGWDGEQGMI